MDFGYDRWLKQEQEHGFVECFSGAILDEFFSIAFQARYYEILNELQTDSER